MAKIFALSKLYYVAQVPPRQAEGACRELSEQVYFPRATREAEAERDREQEGAGRAGSAQHCSESRLSPDQADVQDDSSAWGGQLGRILAGWSTG